MQVETFGVLVVVLVIFAFLFLKAGIKIVSQADNLLIERLGKFHKVLDGGISHHNPICRSDKGDHNNKRAAC